MCKSVQESGSCERAGELGCALALGKELGTGQEVSRTGTGGVWSQGKDRRCLELGQDRRCPEQGTGGV